MTSTDPIWRSFQTLASNAESASVSACCDFSLQTLEVSCPDPGMVSFALTERKCSDTWRWAIFDRLDSLLGEGCEPTRQRAKLAAELALHWCRTESRPPAAPDPGLGRNERRLHPDL